MIVETRPGAHELCRARPRATRCGARSHALPDEQREVVDPEGVPGAHLPRDRRRSLDVPVSTVKTRLYRGLGQLRLRLETQGVREERAGAGAGALRRAQYGRRTKMECEEDRGRGASGATRWTSSTARPTARRARGSRRTSRACAACRDEMAALRGLRRDLAQLAPSRRATAFTPRGVVVPHWLLAAALVLVGLRRDPRRLGLRSRCGGRSSRRRRARRELERQQRESLAGARRRRSRARRAPRPTPPRCSRASRPRLDERLRVEPGAAGRAPGPALRRVAGARRGAAARRHGAGGGEPQLPRRPPRASSSRGPTS